MPSKKQRKKPELLIDRPSDELKKEFAAAGVEHSKKKQKKAHKALIDKGYKDAIPTSKKEQLRNDWKLLRETAKKTFPVYLLPEYEDISDQQRIVAIAYALGWKVGDISAASGVAQSTLSEWLVRADIKLFIDEINYCHGDKPIMDKVERLQYPAIRTMEMLMADTRTPPHLRVQIAQWMVERKFGKPTQHAEVRHDVRELTRKLQERDNALPRPRRLLPTDKDEDVIDVEGETVN